MNINIFDVQKIEWNYRRFVDEFERIDQRVKEKLNLILFQLNVWVLQPFDIVLYRTIVRVLGNRDKVTSFFIVVQYLDKRWICLVDL